MVRRVAARLGVYRAAVTVVYPYRWYWRVRLGERRGQRCRVLASSREFNSVLVEFEDGYRVVTAWWAIRRV